MPTEPQSTGGAARPPATDVTDAPQALPTTPSSPAEAQSSSPSPAAPSTPGGDKDLADDTDATADETAAASDEPDDVATAHEDAQDDTATADAAEDDARDAAPADSDEAADDEPVANDDDTDADAPPAPDEANATPAAGFPGPVRTATADDETGSSTDPAASPAGPAGETPDAQHPTDDAEDAPPSNSSDEAKPADETPQDDEPGDTSDTDASDDAGAGADDDDAPQPDDSVQIALSAIETARAAVADGDAAGTIRALRSMPERLLLADDETFTGVTELVARAARAAGFDDLAAAADGARAQPSDPYALYGYGYSCVERGVAYLAVPALTRALAQAPEADTVRMELVSALEAEARNADAVRVLAGSNAMEHWTGRYLLVFNCLMSGDVDGARQWYTRLGKPEDRRQETMLNRLTAMLTRVQLLTGTELLDDAQGTPEDPHAPLGSADLRGWHFAVNAGVLTTLSPYGADAGMNGRYAYLAETYSSCHWALHRLRIALEAGDRLPPVLGLLPDRSSRIMGIAMAELLGVQAWDWRPQMEGALVMAHSLADAAPHVLSGLSTAHGQLIVEHATCWTDPPPVASDASSLLHQVVVPPWGSRRLPSPEGDRWVDEPADDRPEREIAAEILSAPAVPDPGDGSTAPDTDDDLAYFVARIAPLWARAEGHRDRVWSPGPVHSSRFW